MRARDRRGASAGCALRFRRYFWERRNAAWPRSGSPWFDDALGQVEAWLGAPAAVVVSPTPRHPSVLRGLLRTSRTSGNLTTDAHLAALALEHGATIVSHDRGFARFEGVRHRLPG